MEYKAVKATFEFDDGLEVLFTGENAQAIWYEAGLLYPVPRPVVEIRKFARILPPLGEDLIGLSLSSITGQITRMPCVTNEERFPETYAAGRAKNREQGQPTSEKEQ